MKNGFMVLALVLLCLSAFAVEKRKPAADGRAHDGIQGNCQEAAQTAVDALNKINAPNSAQMPVVLQNRPTQVENYTTGGKNPSYRLTTVTGRGEGQCFVVKVSFNPEP